MKPWFDVKVADLEDVEEMKSMRDIAQTEPSKIDLKPKPPLAGCNHPNHINTTPSLVYLSNHSFHALRPPSIHSSIRSFIEQSKGPPPAIVFPQGDEGPGGYDYDYTTRTTFFITHPVSLIITTLLLSMIAMSIWGTPPAILFSPHGYTTTINPTHITID